MAKKIPYESLAIVPELVAEQVVREVYTGEEMGHKLQHSSTIIKATEAARQAMTFEQIEEFIQLTDKRCRDAYEANAEWALALGRKGNAGRDTLYSFTRHWLSAYLNDPEAYRRTLNAPAPAPAFDWKFSGRGEWECFSDASEGQVFYRIAVCDDGTFDVTESETKFSPKPSCFDTLTEAKRFCEAHDAKLAAESPKVPA